MVIVHTDTMPYCEVCRGKPVVVVSAGFCTHEDGEAEGRTRASPSSCRGKTATFGSVLGERLQSLGVELRLNSLQQTQLEKIIFDIKNE